MRSHRLLGVALVASLISIDGYSQTSNPTAPTESLAQNPAPPAPNPEPPKQNLSCGCAPMPARIAIRHIEANGVGYNQGYTTLEAFFSPYEPLDCRWVPILDLRGHVFNDSRFAANAGIGLRYLSSSRVWGINTFYDYRNTRHHTYHQAAFGLESLGEIWDFRLNGYLPFGSKKSSFYDLRFDHFINNYMFQSRKREFAMKGFNCEVGAHVQTFEELPLYFAAGPYYLTGGKTTWGGEARLAMDCGDYVRLEAATSYDHLFQWIGQGQISLILPLGRKREVKSTCNRSCCSLLALSERAVQRIDRNEIIPVDHKRTQSLAIDPATGLPYFILFVNNLSHSAGTFESPFGYLSDAQTASQLRNIIYVFEGDGTTNQMDSGFIMKANQHLWGSGVNQQLQTTWGWVTIPALTSGFPTVTGPSSSTNGIITLANGCEVSGMRMIDPTSGSYFYGIYGNPITDAWIHNNQIDFNTSTTLTDVGGIYLDLSQGKVDISDNTVTIAQNGGSIVNLYGIYAVSYPASGDNVSQFSLNQNKTIISQNSGTIVGPNNEGCLYGIYAKSNSNHDNNSQYSLNQNEIIISQNAGTITNELFGISANSGATHNNVSQMILNDNETDISQNSGLIASVLGIQPSSSSGNINASLCSFYNNETNITQNGGTIDSVHGIYSNSIGHPATDNNSQWSFNDNEINIVQNGGTITNTPLGFVLHAGFQGVFSLSLIENFSYPPIELIKMGTQEIHLIKNVGNHPKPIGP